MCSVGIVEAWWRGRNWEYIRFNGNLDEVEMVVRTLPRIFALSNQSSSNCFHLIQPAPVYGKPCERKYERLRLYAILRSCLFLAARCGTRTRILATLNRSMN